MLEQLGIERERFKLVWVSASEGENFAKIVADMTQEIKQLGPMKVSKGGEKLA
jgi:F420-non-reducing hydrogenase iron-sulfur subunit